MTFTALIICTHYKRAFLSYNSYKRCASNSLTVEENLPVIFKQKNEQKSQSGPMIQTSCTHKIIKVGNSLYCTFSTQKS